MPNPNGHSETLVPWTTTRKESCTAQVSVRIPPSIKAKLKNVDGWHEEVRKFLAELTDRIPA